MYPREFLIEQHRVIMDHKEHCWYQHKSNDMPPQMTVRWRDMKPQAIDLMGVINGLLERPRIASMSERRKRNALAPFRVIAGILEMLKQEKHQLPNLDYPPNGTPLEAVWVALEAFQRVKHYDSGTPFETIKADVQAAAKVQLGDLQDEFATNPASDIREAVITYIVETSSTGLAEWAVVTTTLIKGDAGRIVWDEPMVVTSEDENPFPQLGGGRLRVIQSITPYVTRENLT